MKLKFTFPDGTTKISNNFYVEMENQEAILDDFFDNFLGGNEKQPEELFWNAKVEGYSDFIIVRWLEHPQNINEILDSIGDWFGQKIDDFENWT